MTGSLQHAEGVLADAALDEFQQELPHWWQRIGGLPKGCPFLPSSDSSMFVLHAGDYFLRPVGRSLPRLRSSPWSFLRTEKVLRGNGLVKSEGANEFINTPCCRLCRSCLCASRWSLLSQLARLAGGSFPLACSLLCGSRVAGSLQSLGPVANIEKNLVTLPTALDRRGLASKPAHSAQQALRAYLDLAGHGARCTRSLATPFDPQSKRSHVGFSSPFTSARQVVQTSLLKEYRPQEIKALMGFEVGQLVLRRLPAVIPQELREPLTYGIFAARAYDALCQITEPNQALAGAPPWIRRMLTGRARSWKRPYSHTGTTAEFEALGVILRRLVPGPLLPPIFAGLAVNSNEIAEALEHRKPPKWQLRGSPAPQPLRDLAGNALVLALIRLFSGSRGRSHVLTLEAWHHHFCLQLL